MSITPQENADTLAALQSGTLDGAWVPEPWATRLVLEGGGHVLVNEADLWPDGDFVTTHLIVSTEFLDEHPDAVKALIVGLGQAIDQAGADAAAAQLIVNDGIEAITTKRLGDETITGAWANLRIHTRPDHGVAAWIGRRRRSRRPARARRPRVTRHLRPYPAQRGADRTW